MSYQWRDLIGALLSNKYRLTEYLGELPVMVYLQQTQKTGLRSFDWLRTKLQGPSELFGNGRRPCGFRIRASSGRTKRDGMNWMALLCIYGNRAARR